MFSDENGSVASRDHRNRTNPGKTGSQGAIITKQAYYPSERKVQSPETSIPLKMRSLLCLEMSETGCPLSGVTFQKNEIVVPRRRWVLRACVASCKKSL